MRRVRPRVSVQVPVGERALDAVGPLVDLVPPSVHVADVWPLLAIAAAAAAQAVAGEEDDS